jgi:hypothetical protein
MVAALGQPKAAFEEPNPTREVVHSLYEYVNEDRENLSAH